MKGIDIVYNFDKDNDRKNSTSYKWTFEIEKDEIKKGLYPMTVADMEFDVSNSIKKSILKRVERGVFGYEALSENYYNAVKNRLKLKHNLDIENSDIIENTNAIVSLSIALQAFSDIGDEVIIHSPGYMNFFTTTQLLDRKILESPLAVIDDKYEIDFEQMESIVTPKTKILIFCNPQNPTGNVWSLEDVTKICEFAKRHNILIISDELHKDFVFNGVKHIMTENISRKIGSKCITLISPGKSFNVSGCKTSCAIITDEKIRNKFVETKEKLRFPSAHIFAESIILGAYSEEGEKWQNAVKEYICENKEIFINFVKEKLPKIKIRKTDATYLLWVDFSELKLSDEELEKLLKEKCLIKVSDGKAFGSFYSQCRRFNIAIQREKLFEILDRIYNVFEKENLN